MEDRPGAGEEAAAERAEQFEGKEASTRTALRAGTIAYSANEDWPNHRGASASPAPSVNRAAFSVRPPKRLSAANRSQ